MGKLIFTYTDKDFLTLNREASKIELDVPDDMDINEFKIAFLVPNIAKRSSELSQRICL